MRTENIIVKHLVGVIIGKEQEFLKGKQMSALRSCEKSIHLKIIPNLK